MKRLAALIMAILILSSSSAYAFGFEDLLGGLSTIFGSDEDIPTYEVGEKGTVEGITATLVKVSESKGNKTYTPAKGHVYLICEFKIENGTVEDLILSSALCFNATLDDTTYQLSIEALAISMLAGTYQLDQVVEAGKRINGVVGYEVPIGWKELRIKFTPDGWGGDSIAFVANR